LSGVGALEWRSLEVIERAVHFSHSEEVAMLARIPLVLAVFVVAFVVAATATAAVTTPARTLTASAAVGDKININTADVKALMTLEGVGRKVAEKIVEYRQAHGPFKKADELRKVDGIGGGLWERNKERIVVK
jgi:competence ComEA-like helix-hairpin-helix protein